MDATRNFQALHNLTGQVSILDIVPKFTGNYSSVYLGALNGNYVAIKVIKATGGDHSVNRKVLREISLWAATSHRNIHPFYGFINDRWCGQFGALISPWCLNGDATMYLQKNGGRLVMAERINLWRGVMEGVAYLHRHNPIIIHGDLKPGNVLIDDLGTPRICDFGLARVFLEAESTGMTTTSEHTGTTRYLAPELLTSEENVYPTTASDVYALGCLGLELLYDQKPYSNRANNLRGQIFYDIRGGTPPAMTPPQNHWACKHVWPIVEQLWSLDPLHRPSASHAIFVLKQNTRSLPPAAIQSIALFSATAVDRESWPESWIQRAQTLLALSLVSKLFCTHVTPFLYQDIRLGPQVTTSILSKLAHTLNKSIKNSGAFDCSPEGYGSYSRTFVLHSGRGAHTLSAKIKDILHKMTRLHTCVIRTTGAYDVEIPVYPLSTLKLEGTSASRLILDQGFVGVSLRFQRVYIDQSKDPYPIIPDASWTQRILSLPNVQDIVILGNIKVTGLLQGLADCVMPNLTSLSLQFTSLRSGRRAAFIGLLRIHGQFLWYLKLEVDENDAPLVPDILSLCSNLRSLVVASTHYTELSSFPFHPKLEILDIEAGLYYAGGSGVPYLAQFEELRSSWQIGFPNLRVARFKWPTLGLVGRDGIVKLEANFRTEDSFYTLYDGTMTYKQYKGSWMGSGASDIFAESSAEPSCHRFHPRSM